MNILQVDHLAEGETVELNTLTEALRAYARKAADGRTYLLTMQLAPGNWSEVKTPGGPLRIFGIGVGVGLSAIGTDNVADGATVHLETPRGTLAATGVSFHAPPEWPVIQEPVLDASAIQVGIPESIGLDLWQLLKDGVDEVLTHVSKAPVDVPLNALEKAGHELALLVQGIFHKKA